jgi:small subunit ribosomal protein S10e
MQIRERGLTDIFLARLIPKADRKKIHEYLFREGVLVAKKDFNLPKHGDIDTKNLYVCSKRLFPN